MIQCLLTYILFLAYARTHTHTHNTHPHFCLWMNGTHATFCNNPRAGTVVKLGIA